MVGEAVPDKAQSAFFNVLFNGIEYFLFGNFHLSIGPAGNLDDHVEDALVLIGE